MSLAGNMRRRGMGEAEILVAPQVANERRRDPPLDAAEVEGIAVSEAGGMDKAFVILG
jgi:Primase C terminal 1 (PriCT-1)